MKMVWTATTLIVLSLVTGCSGGGTGSLDQAALNHDRLGETSTRPSDGMTMVYVPGGTFEMGGGGGRENRAHSVTLDSYWIDQTEVTNSHFQSCAEAGVCRPPTTCSWGDPTYADPSYADHPVICVSWQEAVEYCEWAGGRLPTEAEWEYAARGPQGLAYPWGNTFDGTRLNSCDINCPHTDDRNPDYDDGYPMTSPVGSFPEGVSWCEALDMSGNVWEWVADWHGAYPSQPQINPTGPASGHERLIRGGSWYEGDPGWLRTDERHPYDPRADIYLIGFRCIMDDGQ